MLGRKSIPTNIQSQAPQSSARKGRRKRKNGTPPGVSASTFSLADVGADEERPFADCVRKEEERVEEIVREATEIERRAFTSKGAITRAEYEGLLEKQRELNDRVTLLLEQHNLLLGRMELMFYELSEGALLLAFDPSITSVADGAPGIGPD